MLNLTAIGIILLSAAITFFLRALPFLFFRGDHRMPSWLQQLGQVLPAALMAVLVIYCLKEVPEDPLRTGIPQLLAILVVAVSYKWKHNTLISIVLGTGSYMVLLHAI